MKKIILGLAGEIASGKGTASLYLQENFKAGTYRFSTALRDVAKRMHLEESRQNLQKISTLFRENFDKNILSRVIAEDVKKDNKQLVVIDGVRRMADIEYLKRLEGFFLVYIEAEMKKRYQRLILRGENSDDLSKTFEQFQEDQQREAELQIKDLKSKADFVLDNNQTKKDFYLQIDKLIKSLK